MLCLLLKQSTVHKFAKTLVTSKFLMHRDEDKCIELMEKTHINLYITPLIIVCKI